MTPYRDTKKQTSKPTEQNWGLRRGEKAQGWRVSCVWDLLKGYFLLAMYVGGTQLLGLGFFQIAAGSRAMWIIGALFLLVLVTMRGCQPQEAAQRSPRTR